MAHNPDYRRLINTARWRRLRHSVLEDHPVCERCGVCAACEVHHRVPVESAPGLRAMERLMFDRGNLQALCRRCHVAAHVEMGRCGRAAAAARIEARRRVALRVLFGEDPGG